jgi:hypothetical protein
LQCTIHDGLISLSDDEERVELELATVKASSAR